MDVYLEKSFLSKFGKWNHSLETLAVETASQNLQGVDLDSIDLFLFTSFSPDVYTGETHLSAKIADAIGIRNAFVFRSETASSSGASALHIAYHFLSSGQFSKALVLGGELMSKLDREKSNLLLGSVMGEGQIALGMSMAQGGALVTNRYLYEYGYKREDLFFLSKKLHDNGLKNPNAHIQKNLTSEEYAKAPTFCSPLGLYDISPLSDGLAGVLLTTSRTEMVVRGVGYGTSPISAIPGTSFPASCKAFSKAYAMAKISPKEISAAELHDAFTPFELVGAEDAGLFPKGKALRAVIEKETDIDGRLPINPSGGLKSRGHPIGASGLAQIVELRNFLRDYRKQFGLAHSIGGLATNNFATILENLG